jgi:hypothetical protein
LASGCAVVITSSPPLPEHHSTAKHRPAALVDGGEQVGLVPIAPTLFTYF